MKTMKRRFSTKAPSSTTSSTPPLSPSFSSRPSTSSEASMPSRPSTPPMPTTDNTQKTTYSLRHINPERLQDLSYRCDYTTSFLGFTRDDQAALHAAKPYLAPLIPTVMELVYKKLLSYDITAVAFVSRNTGFDDSTPADPAKFDTSHEQINYRKNFLEKYIVKLVTADYFDESTYQYFDRVAKMHTGTMGEYSAKKKLLMMKKKNEDEPRSLRVEYIHMALLLGYVVDILIPAVMGLDGVAMEVKLAVLKALNKVVWIQNDLFAKHYLKDENDSGFTPLYFPSIH